MVPKLASLIFHVAFCDVFLLVVAVYGVENRVSVGICRTCGWIEDCGFGLARLQKVAQIEAHGRLLCSVLATHCDLPQSVELSPHWQVQHIPATAGGPG